VAASENLGSSSLSGRLKEGTAVVICGVVSKPALNGQQGCVTRWNQTKHRYAVKIKEGVNILLKPENIAALDTGVGDVDVVGATSAVSSE
jgi:hypothetical protein